MASQTTTATPWEPIQQPILDTVQQYGDLVNQGVNYFPGSTVANQSQNTQQGTSALAGAAGSQQGVIDQSNQAFNFATGDVMNPSSNQFLQASAQNAIQPVIDQLMKQILPGIGQSAGQAGGFGGTAHANLKQNAINDAMKNAMNTTENMYSNAYGQNLSAYMQALGMAPQQVDIQTAPSRTQLAAGGIEDARSQQLVDADVARHNFGQTGQMQLLDQFLQTLQGFPVTQTSTAESDPSPLDRVFDIFGL